MGTEGFPITQSAELSQEQALQAEQLHARFGIGWEEGQQQVEAGQYRGTLAQMLLDPKCPVGQGVQEAYLEGQKEDRGPDAVQEKLDSFKMVFSNFKADVGERFITAQAEKKKSQMNS